MKLTFILLTVALLLIHLRLLAHLPHPRLLARLEHNFINLYTPLQQSRL